MGFPYILIVIIRIELIRINREVPPNFIGKPNRKRLMQNTQCKSVQKILETIEYSSLSNSVKSVEKSRRLLSELSRMDYVDTESIEKSIVKINPELFAYIFNTARIDPREVESRSTKEWLHVAILRLGFEEIKRRIVFFLIYSENVNDSMPKIVQKFASRLWFTGFEIGRRTSNALRAYSTKIADEVFFIAMMQNLGIVAMIHAETEAYIKIIESKRRLSLVEKERLVFGFDHYVIGRAIVEAWGLPDSHYRSILFEECGGELPFIEESPEEMVMFKILYFNRHVIESESKLSKGNSKRIGFDRYFSFNEMLLDEVRKLVESDLLSSNNSN